jgi:hypothetical protein
MVDLRVYSVIARQTYLPRKQIPKKDLGFRFEGSCW